MIPDDLRSPLAGLLATAGLGEALGATPLAGGANNRVFRVETAVRPVVAKVYFHHPDDRRDRLEAEYAFARLAWDGGIRVLPEPLAVDRHHRIGLFTLVDGRRPVPADVDEAAVTAMLAFLVAVNRCCPRSETAEAEGSANGNLPAAAEACFSLADHLETVNRRLGLLRAMPQPTPQHRDAARLIETQIDPLWRALAATVQDGAVRLGIENAAVLPMAGRILSPSDFGFHNALVRPDGGLSFLDFEYAGWDDPAKLVGDIFHQVAIPVPHRHYRLVRDAVASMTARPEQEAARFDLLLPVYAVKWIAILLNDFLPVGNRRRLFAGGEEAEERRARQLVKAEAALEALRASSIRYGTEGITA